MQLRGNSYVKTAIRHCVPLSLIELYDRNGRRYRLQSQSLSKVFEHVDYHHPIEKPLPNERLVSQIIRQSPSQPVSEETHFYQSIARPSRPSRLSTLPPALPARLEPSTPTLSTARIIANPNLYPGHTVLAETDVMIRPTRDSRRIPTEHHLIVPHRVRHATAASKWPSLLTACILVLVFLLLGFFLAMAYWIAHAGN